MDKNNLKEYQMRKRWVFMIAVAMLYAGCISALFITGCDDADIASRNISKAADNFEVLRRVVFYNGINGEYILTIEGFCSIYDDGLGQLEITCKTGPQSYKKHYLGLSDNVTYFSEQLDSSDVSVDHYRITFKPSVIIPDIDLR